MVECSGQKEEGTILYGMHGMMHVQGPVINYYELLEVVVEADCPAVHAFTAVAALVTLPI